MPRDLSGLPLAITGAGTGIGRATAIACAKAGMPVALAGRREAPLRDTAETITRLGVKAIVVPTDVADAAQCRAFIEKTIDAFGSIYSVFANAGYGLRGPVHELEESKIRDIFETNFWGTLNTVKPALEHMLAAPDAPGGRGHVLMCSSCLSKIGTPYTAPYSATKAVQDHFGRGMRHELRHLGVHVSTVHPIGTRTEFLDASAKRSGGSKGSKEPPALFTQPADRVASAVVKCLRKPKGEVWTSLFVRLAFAGATACPGFADRLLARAFRDSGSHDE